MADTRTWRYRRGEDGKIEGRIFPSPEDVPEGEGWHDSPADVGESGPDPEMDLDPKPMKEPEKAPEPEAEAKPKRRPGRPKGAKNKPKPTLETEPARLGA